MTDTTKQIDLIEHTLKRGAEYPYHGQEPKTWAEVAACAILYDLNDRRGIKHALREIDNDVRAEIVESFTKYIERAARAAPVSPAQPERQLDMYDEIECDLPHLFGRASKEGHEVGQQLAQEVRAKMQKARTAAPARPQSDLSEQLREYASNPGYSHGDYADTMREAADELDRHAAAELVASHEAANLVAAAQSKYASSAIWLWDDKKERHTLAVPVASLVGAQVAGEAVYQCREPRSGEDCDWQEFDKDEWEALRADKDASAKLQFRTLYTAPVPAPATKPEAVAPVVVTGVTVPGKEHLRYYVRLIRSIVDLGLYGVLARAHINAAIELSHSLAGMVGESVEEIVAAGAEWDEIFRKAHPEFYEVPATPVAVAPVAGEGLTEQVAFDLAVQSGRSDQFDFRVPGTSESHKVKCAVLEPSDALKFAHAILSTQAERQPQPAAQAAVPEGLVHVGTLSVYEDKEATFGHAYDISTNMAGHKALQAMDGYDLFAAPAAVQARNEVSDNPQGVNCDTPIGYRRERTDPAEAANRMIAEVAPQDVQQSQQAGKEGA